MHAQQQGLTWLSRCAGTMCHRSQCAKYSTGGVSGGLQAKNLNQPRAHVCHCAAPRLR